MVSINVAYNMDCMEAMRKMPDKCFDLAVVDPPYRDAAENAPTKDMRLNGTLKCFGDKPKKEYFDELFRVSKEQIIWGCNNFDLPNYKGFLVWRKLTISDDFTMSMAEIAYLSEGLGTVSKVFDYAPQGTKDDPRIHPTQNPIALYAWIFQHYAKSGDKILDTHLGSGSSRIAAYDAGLDFVGYEIDKDYFDKQEERFAAHTAQCSLFVKRGGILSSPRYDWWGYVKAMIRRYPRMKNENVSGNALKEKEAVRVSIEQTEALDNGKERIEFISMVFWKQTHTLAGAAMAIPCSERTARRWHTEFIKTVAKNYGLLD